MYIHVIYVFFCFTIRGWVLQSCAEFFFYECPEVVVCAYTGLS